MHRGIGSSNAVSALRSPSPVLVLRRIIRVSNKNEDLSEECLRQWAIGTLLSTETEFASSGGKLRLEAPGVGVLFCPARNSS